MASTDMASFDMRLKVLAWLKNTRFAATSLKALSGGSANFVYLARLQQPLEDGTVDVVVKHGEPYMAAHPRNRLATNRCLVEFECLKSLSSVEMHLEHPGAGQCTVRTPKCLYYDEETKTQIQEYIPEGINLKAYATKYFSSPTTPSLRPQCHDIGKLLAQYIVKFHSRTTRSGGNAAEGGIEAQSSIREVLNSNKEMQALKHFINYDWLIQRIDQFPHILSEARDVFTQVKEDALKELDMAEHLTTVHGDFWTGNVLLPDSPIQAGTKTSMLVVDWENAQLGVENLDHGEMIGEMYALWVYKRVDGGLWMVQGYTEGLGTRTEEFIWRLAVEIGCHLLSFGTIAPGWGTPSQVDDVARHGRDIILNARQKDRAWFDQSELACLFKGK
ncbi:hypothetical protein BR93DRAFT_962166 [Coniochaeta sp. PMI_546]|nr:hypothetical protein BR93DRAFT_962166 [Coniochaeta sp. PMI_546]